VRDGYRTLFELGAIDENQELTEIGRRLSRLPVDPRIGRMILASIDEGCLPQMLIIASALEVQDPRERPLEKQEAADACHVQFADEQSDFLGYLKIWNFYHKLKSTLSRNQLQKACRQNFLSYLRMREWLDVHRELMEMVEEGRRKQPLAASQRVSQGIAKPQAAHSAFPLPPSAIDSIHRAILTGLLSSVALRGESHEYSVAGGGKAMLWPGSGVFNNRPKWIVAAELVETTRRYLRTCARIDPRWIEPLAGHVIKRTYSDLQWNSGWASAVALERLTLFGLPVVAGRPIRYGPIDPVASRQLFVEHALVYGDLNPKPTFLVHNEALREKMEELQAKLRRRDLLASDGNLYAFYDERLPDEVYDGATLVKWIRRDRDRHTQLLTMTESDLTQQPVEVGEDAFPDRLEVKNLELPLEYTFEPGTQNDGVTMSVPLEALGQVDPEPLEWLVPGLLEEKVLAMIRSLPKTLRTRFVPAPTMARQVAALLRHREGNLREAVAAVLSRIGGVAVSPRDFENDRLPPELQMNVRVTGTEGQTLASGRDLSELRQQLAVEAADVFTSIDDPRWNRDGIAEWDLDELSPEIEIARAGLRLKAYPALVDQGTSVSLRLMESRERADHETRFALRRLFLFTCLHELKTQVDWLPGLEAIEQGGMSGATVVSSVPRLDTGKMPVAPAKSKPEAQARNVRRPAGSDTFLACASGFDLRQQLVELLADRALFGDQADGTRSVPATLMPRTKAEFDARIAAGRERIGWAVQELTALTGPWFDAYRELQQTLAARTAPAAPVWGRLTTGPVPVAKWQYALDDIHEQLDALTAGSAISSTPWNWLRHYPRYFRAISMRLDTLAGGGAARDRQCLDELRPRWELYLEAARQQAAQNVYDPELMQHRWMLEEYRVSLFAQKLGTAVPVSPKRLDQQWAKVRG
jgi:ATP-dependent helicase HrpA